MSCLIHFCCGILCNCGLEGINGVLILLLVDSAAVWFPLDIVSHVYDLSDIVDCSQGNTMLEILLWLIYL